MLVYLVMVLTYNNFTNPHGPFTWFVQSLQMFRCSNYSIAHIPDSFMWSTIRRRSIYIWYYSHILSSKYIIFLYSMFNRVAIGYDEGTIMIKIGRELPVASMGSSGMIIWARKIKL
ncbi:hypothetical protein FRX31_003572 [Thalictrum thalictroides]|uniref:Uncharacterized protein n=1 Tax=Thalictrum thalictroides TaxID=46969 RepID=A0A7J6XAN5_THATH|nr:hypothetical protein FRX31_003572 [Thalictrum thalictroides]